MSDATHHTSLPKRLIIAAAGAALIVSAGAAALTMDSAGAAETKSLDDGQHLVSEVEISPEEALDIALGEVDGYVDDFDLERNGDQFVYEIEIDDTDIDVDANDGSVLYVEHDDDDDRQHQRKTAADDRDQQEQSSTASSDASDSSKSSGADEPAISSEEAVEIAAEEVDGTADDVEDVELERESGQLFYEIEIHDTDVYVDAQDGSVLHVDYDDDDDDDDREYRNGTGTRSDGPEISLEEAIAIAEEEVDGRVDDAELDREGGRLIYEIEVGNHDVEVDAMDGSILKVEWDD